MRGAGDPSLRLKNGSAQDDPTKRFKLNHYRAAVKLGRKAVLL
jgi:hypothetical protein